ncbi:Holliday junction resolvase RuvX [Thermomicrobiaceae bacterium CFH 74404]|uniref:Putative pre-16S rRNA nuclease n=1 Tax=Thermalbibacter longus TaxID=2951981 RepID=A0AA41W9F1_9BACT|nr:Holliday junction resolvase RuvX [Thermalbibacter longus]MCM8748114.1 Holliday junction resolvase RuvX [Thermalbibacter longus]
MSKQPHRRYLGLDVGGRRIGVAVSDELGMIASPIESLDRTQRGLERLLALVEQYDPQAIVIGLPTGLSGQEGQQAAEVREFAEQLRPRLDRPIIFWDERLTTAIAERALIESGKRRARRKELVDAVAAAVMLQSFLDSQRK